MTKNYKIRSLQTNQPRTNIYYDDIYIKDWKAHVEHGYIKIGYENSEAYLCLFEPLPCSKFGHYYKFNEVKEELKYTNAKSEEFKDLVKSILFNNERSKSSKRKSDKNDYSYYNCISDFIIKNFVKYSFSESEVFACDNARKPTITNEEVTLIIREIEKLGIMKDYIPNSEKATFFKKGSKIPSYRRRAIAREHMIQIKKEKKAKAIHKGVLKFCEEHKFVKISIADMFKMGYFNDLNVELRTIERNIDALTRKTIKNENKKRQFTSKGEEKDFMKFMKLPNNLTIEEQMKHLDLKRNKVNKFRKIKKISKLESLV